MRDLFVKYGFGLVSFSCIPSFNLLLCLELVKKFVVVGGGGWWVVVVVVVETNYSVKLKLKLNKMERNIVRFHKLDDSDILGVTILIRLRH